MQHGYTKQREKTSRPSLAQYANMEEEVEGRKECSQWLATGERG